MAEPNLVNPDDLMGMIDIADMALVVPTAVANWRRRDKAFPKPITTISHGTPIWLKSEIVKWLEQSNRMPVGYYSETN